MKKVGLGLSIILVCGGNGIYAESFKESPLITGKDVFPGDDGEEEAEAPETVPITPSPQTPPPSCPQKTPAKPTTK